MKLLSTSAAIRRPAPEAFRSWRLVFLSVMLLAAVICGALYVEVAQAQGVDGAITGLTLSSDAPGTLTVSWDTASPTPTDYRIDWAKSDEGYTSWKVNRGHVYPDATATTATITDLSHDTEYKIRMRARYYKGEHYGKSWGGPWAKASLQVAGTPEEEQAPEPPAPPKLTPTTEPVRRDSPPQQQTALPAAPNLMGTLLTPEGEVMLVWQDPSDDSITGYQILRGPASDDLAVIEDDTGSSGTSYTDTSPPTGQTHTYAVKARNPAGLSPLSNTLTATVPEPEPEEELVTSRQDSEEILVSNHGEASGSPGNIAQTQKGAQAFVTGPGLAGFSYHFQGIRVSAGAGEFGGTILTPQVQATIHNDNNGLPGTLLHTLTLPADFASTGALTAYTLTAPSGTVLNRNTRYWVVLEVLSGTLGYDTTTSTDEDQRQDGWSIDNRRYGRGTGDWVSLPRVIKLAVLGSPAWVTDEADGPDLPGAWFNAHKTNGVVTSGTDSTGHLTTGLDRNHGLTGDYWWLETQPGHTYRVEVKFGDNPTIDTGGSAVISFIDPNDDDYPDASTCCESDHNRDDGATFIHFYRPTDEWNRRYLVNVTVYDNYNTGSANYNGPYTVTLTDITGVQRMVHTFSGGETRDSNQLLDDVDDVTKIADIATRFTTGGHAAGYTLDRIKFLFNEIRNDGVTPVISLHSHTTSGPGAKVCDIAVPGRVAESTVTLTPIHRRGRVRGLLKK